MPFPVIPTVELFEQLNALVADRYPVAPNKALVKLFKNDVNPDVASEVLSFEEADYVGYADVEILMQAASMNDQGVCTTRSNLVTFSSAGGVDPQVVYGIYIVDQPGTALLAAQRFESPQEMGGAFPQSVNGLWRFSNPPSNYGWIDVEN